MPWPDSSLSIPGSPTTATGIVGGVNPVNAVVDMYIEDVVGLNAVDLRISFFDTTIAQVVDQLPASGAQIQPLNTFLQPDFVVRNTAGNTAGTIRYAATQAFPSLPVDGSAILIGCCLPEAIVL